MEWLAFDEEITREMRLYALHVWTRYQELRSMSMAAALLSSELGLLL
jgi:hypothetical protein